MLKITNCNIDIFQIIHFSKGKEMESEANTFSNTRGFIIEGDIGKSNFKIRVRIIPRASLLLM